MEIHDTSTLDAYIRDPNKERKGVAELLGISATGLYSYLRDVHKVCIASVPFLVDAYTGKPLSPIDDNLIESCGEKAIRKHRKVLLAS